MPARPSPGGIPWIGRGLAAALLLVLLACPGEADPKPDASVVTHLLPFPAGQSYLCFQGNDQGPTHHDQYNRYAFDFSPMPEGSPVCATADGVVVFVKEDAVGPTGRYQDNNEVAIRHADGTVSQYAHLQKDGALVEVDQQVYAGDVIGRSGNTGSSAGPHLHFGLRQTTHMGDSVPCRFADVPGDGVPKTGDTVTSQNHGSQRLREALGRIGAAYDRAAALDAREAVVPLLAPLLKPAPPPDIATILAGYGKRPDVVARYGELRDELLGRYRADGDAALAEVRKAREAGELARAVSLVHRARVDYAPLEVAGPLGLELAELKKNPGYGKAYEQFTPLLAWRRELVRVLGLEAKARAAVAKKQKPGWPAIWPLYDALVKKAPEEERKAALDAHVKALRAEVGTGS